MNTFILIITLLGSSSQSGKAVTSVEFADKQACMAAAEAWKSSLPIRLGNGRWGEAEGARFADYSGPALAICVAKASKP